MTTPAKAHEPTMEEILASIRRIISDDDPAAKPGATPKAENDTGTDPQSAPEVVERDDADAMLAEMDEPALAAEPSPSSPELKRAFEDDLDVLELTEEMEQKPVTSIAPVTLAPAPGPGFAPSPAQSVLAEPASALRPGEALLSASADKQVTDAFGSLANTILAGNAKTLDDIVRDMLRPMLRAWLDDNLPPLVERLVKQEIERVARGGR